jgi:hypothetical protein
LAQHDEGVEAAPASRRWSLEYAVEHGVTYFTSHFPESAAGFIRRRRDGGFEWRYCCVGRQLAPHPKVVAPS